MSHTGHNNIWAGAVLTTVNIFELYKREKEDNVVIIEENKKTDKPDPKRIKPDLEDTLREPMIIGCGWDKE